MDQFNDDRVGPDSWYLWVTCEFCSASFCPQCAKLLMKNHEAMCEAIEEAAKSEAKALKQKGKAKKAKPSG